MCLDSGFGITTRYGLDGPGIESRGGGALSHPGAPPSPLHSGYRVFFLEVKRPGLGVDNPPKLAPRLKKEQSYNCSPSGPSWPVLEWRNKHMPTGVATIRLQDAGSHSGIMFRDNRESYEQEIRYLSEETTLVTSSRWEHNINMDRPNTELFKMIVGVLTTCHKQHTWDRSICVFYSIEQHFLSFCYIPYRCSICDPLWFYRHQHDNHRWHATNSLERTRLSRQLFWITLYRLR